MKFLLTAVLCLTPFLSAQEFRATVTGRVVDASDAAVVGGAVVIKNIDTNEAASTVTTADGSYTVPFLRPGRYSVTVENVPGFKKFLREGLALNVGQTATVNIKLELGGTTEVITVTSDVSALETAKADRGTVIGQLQVNELPLNARNPFMLSTLVAGVNYNGSAIYQRPFDNGAIADWGINGSRNRQAEFLLDGAPNNAQAGGNNLAYVPPVDSVQEFKIQTNSYDAQYGKTGGGIVNVSLKSGTNEIHGTLYEFYRRKFLEANSFQNNARGVPRTDRFLDQYGGLISGPIWIPKIYNGKDKSFFMFNYEGYREGSPNPITASVPAPEFRDGDFSRLLTPQGRQITIFDPTTGRDVNGTFTREPFAGNRIPASRLNPITRRLMSFYPAPNANSPEQDYSRNNYFLSPNVAKDDFLNWTLKFDQNLGSKHRFFFRYAHNDRTETRSTNGIGAGQPGQDGQWPLKRINDAYVMDWVSTLTPTLVFNLRPSFSRYIEGSRGDGNRGFDLTSLGFPAAMRNQLPVPDVFGRYEFSDYLPLGRFFNFNYTNTASVHPTFTWIKGSHTFKFGTDMRSIQYNVQDSGQVFQLTFNRNFTQQQFNRADALSGNAFATALLGTPTGGQVAVNAFPGYRYFYVAPYLQDDWKISRKLTLNLGLRWDYNTPPLEAHNRLTRGFDFNAPSPLQNQINRTQFPFVPELKGGIQFAGVNGNPRRATDMDFNTWQPRAGAAYQVNSKLVLRGGFGVYYVNPNNTLLLPTNFSLNTPLVPSLDENRTSVSNLINNPFPVVQTPPGASTGLLSLAGRGFNFNNTGFRLPRSHQFSFGFQLELPMRSMIDVSYVGNRGYNYQSFDDETRLNRNVNTLENRRLCNPLEGGSVAFCDQGLPNPFRGIEAFRGTGAFTANTANRSQFFRPHPQFEDVWEVARNDGRLWYNSLQATYTMRNWRGIQFTAAYTFARSFERQLFADPIRRIMPNTLQANDRPHRLAMNTNLELPFGKGKFIAGNANKLVNGLIGGWQFNATTIFQSGTPWDLPTNVRVLRDGFNKDVDWSAPIIRGASPCVLRYNDNGTITPQAFSLANNCGTDPSNYAFLILPRFAPREVGDRTSQLRLHTVGQVDLSLNKTTRITERIRVQFRAEAFNFTNSFMFLRAQFNNNPENAAFGTINKGNVGFGDANFPRQLQLAIKILF